MTHRTNTRRHCPQGCTATRELCPSSCTLWEDGEKQNGLLFSLFPWSCSTGRFSACREAESSVLFGPLSASQCSSGHYCTDSGRVLTTWVVSVAVGGEPKKVLVWFL